MTSVIPAELFDGSTEMGRRHRAFDWQSTPLGPPQGWQEGLRTLVPIMLCSNQPMFIVWGKAHTLLYNDAYAELLGHKHPGALGQDFLQVWHEIQADLAPIVTRAYQGEPVAMEDIELWMERRGFREETHFQFFYAPVRDAQGVVCGFLAACTEITGQVVAERRLAVSEARHRGVLAHMDEGFCLFDQDFTVLEVNEATTRMVGLSREEIIGRNHWERFPGTQESELGRMYRRVQSTKQKETIDFMYAYPDGRERWYEIRAFPVQDCLASLFRDITEQRKIMEELRRADRLKDEFLAMLAHELRNPLAPIMTSSQVLRLSANNPTKVIQSSQVIERQVGHLSRLVDDLLDVSRVTRGLVQLERSPVDLREVLANAVEQTRDLIKSRDHELQVRIDGNALFVRGDFDRLVQVLTNLINNAAKYTPRGGRIQVSLNKEGEHVVLAVQDNGIGIAENFLPHVFDLFAQGPRKADRTEGGLGIGLSLVRSLVEMHGGQVRATSTKGQPGSTFTVTLPLSHDVPASAPQAVALAPARRPRRVLVVDDNVDSAKTLADVLRMMGHSAETAHDGKGAMALADHGPPWDVFILDIGLPDMTGYELAASLRTKACAGHAIFVAISGYTPSEQSQPGARGFDHYLVKPADLQHLSGILEGV